MRNTFPITLNGKRSTAFLTGKHSDFGVEICLLALNVILWISYEQFFEAGEI